MRFAAAPQTDETEWQALVLRHLGLAHVEVLELRDELDALGPLATSVLRRHGVRWPGNAYMHAPLLELARGGSLLTGIGGDELFGTTAARHVLVARRRLRPRPRDLPAFALAMLPRSVRAVVWRRRNPPPYPWLTPRGVAIVHRALAADDVAWPARWDGSLRHWYGSRAFAALDGVLDLVADGQDVRVLNPLLEPTVLAELAVAGGPEGFASRDAAMRELFGTLLPEPILTRPTKAAFTVPLWGPAVREFATRWRGEGVDERTVDVEALRAQWLAPEPNFRTVLLLHAAWAAARGGGSAQRVE
jgi:asparagine synthase (glutamine-hydrolysing)